MSLLNYVPFMPTCLTCLRAYVPTCLTCLTCLRVLNYYVPTYLRVLIYYVPPYLNLPRAYVPTCLKLLRALNHYVPTCLRTYVPSFFTHSRVYIYFSCLRALNYFVPTCAHFSRAYVPTATHKIYCLGSFLYLALLFFSGLFYLSFHSKPQKKLLLLKLYTPTLSWEFCYLNWCMRRNNNLLYNFIEITL